MKNEWTEQDLRQFVESSRPVFQDVSLTQVKDIILIAVACVLVAAVLVSVFQGFSCRYGIRLYQ